MRAISKRLRPSFFMLSLLALSALGPSAAARNIIEGFSRAPTFTPPDGCVAREQTYGVLSRCEKTIEPGRTFVVLIDTAAGSGATSEEFVTDHVAEIRAYWTEQRQRKNVAFSSRASDVVPANAPGHLTNCMEYSITVETEKATGGQSVATVSRVEGLTCAWAADPSAHSGHGNWNVEIFWLEAYDEYAPSIGKKPMQSFDLIVRELFSPSGYLCRGLIWSRLMRPRMPCSIGQRAK